MKSKKTSLRAKRSGARQSRNKWIATGAVRLRDDVKGVCLWLMVVALALPALALEVPLEDRAAETRAVEVFKQVRCVVCTGESIHDSQAEIAAQMRHLIRTKIQEGQSEEVILTQLQQSYGDTILMQPPVKAATLPLWLAPLIFLVLGAVVLWRLVWGRKA